MLDLITVEEIAEMVRLTKRQVAERTTHLPDFPRAYVIGGARRWDREDVRLWILKQRERPAGRRR